ncbi:flagellar filament capping protein FliD [Curtobacterium sp. NPDC090217]|uniref:flagellar filament capping protein FliD n=1 Tax=Curtobacterium sp. NPDC090217 TaxID=3363970 RepID=UPI00381AD115
MSSLGIDGLVSGLNTTDLINSLMTIEQVPQTLLKTKVTSTNSFISSLQTINGLFQSLATKATAAAAPTSMSLFTATSSSSSVTASTGNGAATGSVSFTVDATAAAKVGVTAAMATWSDQASPLTLVKPDGTQVELAPASGSLDDTVSAINKAAAGVTATKVASGTAADGTKLYRLQVSSNATGAANGFSLFRGSAADVEAGTAIDVFTQPGAAVVRQATDAAVTLYTGTAAAQTITSASNSFADLLPGVSVSVSTTSADPVTVTIGRDAAKAQSVASGLVDAFTAISSYYSQNTGVTSTTSPTTGTTTTTAGVLLGDATTRSAMQRVGSAMSTPVNGTSPSTIGIVIQKDGTFDFDQDVFQKALAADPAGTQAILSGVAQNVADAANAASDKYTGSITTSITGQQSVVKDLNDQIDAWTDRLSMRRATLQAQYTALETSLSSLKSQSSWLTSQLSTLSTSS